MNNEKMGQFIAELRKAKQMTQKDLAAKLNLTDKAVSKWERGLSFPDISLLSSLAEILGVTTSELLNGEKSDSVSPTVETGIGNALQYADKSAKNRVRSLQSLIALAFSGLLGVGIVVCAICDMAISGAFTWSLIPIGSIVFTWLVFFPVMKFGEKGILITLIALSVLIIPFLWLLDALVLPGGLMSIGIPMAAVSVVFLWAVFALFKLLRKRLLLAGGISLLLTIPLSLVINFSLSTLIAEPLLDVWDVMSFSIVAVIAIALFVLDFRKHRKNA